MAKSKFKQYMKIGTMPASYVYVKYARKPPAVGSEVLVRDVTDSPYKAWERVLVTHYNELGLCFVARW